MAPITAPTITPTLLVAGRADAMTVAQISVTMLSRGAASPRPAPGELSKYLKTTLTHLRLYACSEYLHCAVPTEFLASHA